MIDYKRTDLLAAGAMQTGTLAVLGQLEATRKLLFSGMPADGLSAEHMRLTDAVDAARAAAKVCVEKAEAEYEQLRDGEFAGADEPAAARRDA